MKARKLLVWTIVFILLVGGAFLFYKVFLTQSKPKTLEKNPDNPLPNPNQKELEKYLLEKRLDLQKYFVFNLQKEVKPARLKEKQEWADNERPPTEKLVADLNKLTDYYWKQARQSTEWTVARRTEENYTGKETLSFGKKGTEEWDGEKLSQKIENGENWYIIFEKNDWELYFWVYKAEKRVGLHWAVIVPIDTPTCQVFKDKSTALNFLKKNDPTLKNK